MSARQAVMGGAIPPHVTEYRGELVNAQVSTQNLQELQRYAKENGFELEAECLTRYGYGSNWLSYDEWKAITSEILFQRVSRYNAEPKHYHCCPDCQTSQAHFDRHCEGKHEPGDLEDECYECRERTNRFIQRMPTF